MTTTGSSCLLIGPPLTEELFPALKIVGKVRLGKVS